MVWLTKTTKNPVKTAGYGISIPYRRTLTRDQNFSLFLKPEKTPYRAVWDFEIWFLKIQNPFWDLK
jgi:hypothetical protein